MTQSELDKLHKSIATDFKLATRKTELWDIEYCYDVLHDIKKLMLFQYADSISLIMSDALGNPLKAKKYRAGDVTRVRNDRPGNVDWEDGEGQGLSVVIMHTPQYLGMSYDQQQRFQQEVMRLPWGSSGTDVDFPHLVPQLSKVYTHSNFGIDRTDFS